MVKLVGAEIAPSRATVDSPLQESKIGEDGGMDGECGGAPSHALEGDGVETGVLSGQELSNASEAEGELNALGIKAWLLENCTEQS